MLNFIGRGSAFNVKEGNTSAYIKTDNNLFLLDCGESVFKEIIERKLLDGVEIVNIFVSHLNSDHVGSLSSLLFYLKYKTDIYDNVSVICGQNIENDLINLLKINGNSDTNVVCGVEDIYLEMLENGGIKLIEVNHIQDMSSYGIIFKHDDKFIYYSGDSNEIPYEILKDIDKINYIYQDTCLADYEGNVHLSLKKLCELIEPKHRSKVSIMHIDCAELIEKAKLEWFNVVEVSL